MNVHKIYSVLSFKVLEILKAFRRIMKRFKQLKAP